MARRLYRCPFRFELLDACCYQQNYGTPAVTWAQQPAVVNFKLAKIASLAGRAFKIGMFPNRLIPVEMAYWRTQVLLIEELRRLFQSKQRPTARCISASLVNFLDCADYPKCLQSKQLWNTMGFVADFGTEPALEL